MSHHGTVCFGKNDRETFERALALENDSKNYIGRIFEEASGKKLNSEKDIYSLYIGGESKFPNKVLKLGSSKRTENGFVLSLNGHETAYKLEQKVLPDRSLRPRRNLQETQGFKLYYICGQRSAGGCIRRKKTAYLQYSMTSLKSKAEKPIVQ